MDHVLQVFNPICTSWYLTPFCSSPSRKCIIIRSLMCILQASVCMFAHKYSSPYTCLHHIKARMQRIFGERIQLTWHKITTTYTDIHLYGIYVQCESHIYVYIYRKIGPLTPGNEATRSAGSTCQLQLIYMSKHIK